MKALVWLPAFYSTEVAQVDRVLAFALPASYHLMSCGIRKHLVNEKTAVWAVNLAEGQTG